MSNVQRTMFAAITIQRAFKRYVAIKKEREAKEMTQAAIMIQKNFKGKISFPDNYFKMVFISLLNATYYTLSLSLLIYIIFLTKNFNSLKRTEVGVHLFI